MGNSKKGWGRCKVKGLRFKVKVKGVGYKEELQRLGIFFFLTPYAFNPLTFLLAFL
jgi:hypothetical protein